MDWGRVSDPNMYRRIINSYGNVTSTSIVKCIVSRGKHSAGTKIDRSKVPKLNECDLEESFISGSGPGGQSVNKSVNCCQLRHKPTGIVVKVHQFRDLQENRKIARELLISRLDVMQNGDDSVASQKLRLARERRASRDLQEERRRNMKAEWRKKLADS